MGSFLGSLDSSLTNSSHVIEVLPSTRLSIYNHRTTKTNQKYPSVNL